MKNRVSCLFGVVGSIALLLLAAVSSRAETTRTYTVSAVTGGFSAGSFGSIDNGLLAGVKVDTPVTSSFCIEGDASVVSGSSDEGNATMLLLSLQALYPFLEGDRLRPFLTFGVGGNISSTGDSGPFVNFGVGGKYFLSDNFAIRGDIRDVVATGMGNNVEVSLGVSFVFGGEEIPQRIRRKRSDSAKAVTEESAPVAAAPAGSGQASEEAAAVAEVALPGSSPVAVAVTAPAWVSLPPAIPKPAAAPAPVAAPALVAQSAPAAAPAPTPAAAPGPEAALESVFEPAPVMAVHHQFFTDAKEKEMVAAADSPITAAPSIAEPGPSVSAAKSLMELTVEFDTGMAIIRPSFAKVARKVALFMKHNPDTTAIIRGYTDSIGKAAMNEKLSLKRARRVQQYLTRKYAISPSRFKTIGMGVSYASDNSTAAGRQKNRRAVTIVFETAEALLLNLLR